MTQAPQFTTRKERNGTFTVLRGNEVVLDKMNARGARNLCDSLNAHAPHEETHRVCAKHNIGDESVCCSCTGRTDCSDQPEVAECRCECHNSNLQLCSMCCHHHGYIWHEEHKKVISSHEEKVRASWLRTEIEKLEGMEQENNYSTAYADYTPERAIEEEANTQGYNQALTSIITRYKEELKVLTGE